MPFIQLFEITYILNIRLACDPAIVKKFDSFRKSQSVLFCLIITWKPVIVRVNKSCLEEMGNWEEKSAQKGVGIIYSLVMVQRRIKADRINHGIHGIHGKVHKIILSICAFG